VDPNVETRPNKRFLTPFQSPIAFVDNFRRLAESLDEILQLITHYIIPPDAQSPQDILSSSQSASHLNKFNKITPPLDPNRSHYSGYTSEHQLEKFSTAAKVASCVTKSMCPRVVSNVKEPVYLTRLYGGAELPYPLTFRPYAASHGQLRVDDSFPISSQLPSHVTKKLVEVYVDRVLPQCPVFSPGEVWDIYNNLYGGRTRVKPTSCSDRFIISMIFGIATMTSKAEDYRKVVDLGEAFRREAMRADIDSESLAKTSIRCLQSLLLLAQYALFVPHAANLWHTVSDAMRVAIELGLHQDPSQAFCFDQDVVRSRHRLYWAVNLSLPYI
jgi:Fungal specific transcription factor domain